jgi:hypothetical protein
MGKPTGHDADSANWVGFGYHLSAFYDEYAASSNSTSTTSA